MRRSLSTATGLVAVLVTSAAAHAIGGSARSMRADWPQEESYVTLPPAEAARFSYLGYNELAADVTWSRLLVYYGSGFLGEGDFRYLSNFIDNVITLDPKFKKAYKWSSYSITVNEKHQISSEASDVQKSIEILEKAMVAFPEDYEFFWLAGVRYFLDLKTDNEEELRRHKERGADLMEEAMRKPNAPADLANRAAAFRSKLGQNERAQANLMQMIMTTDDRAAQASMLQNFKYVAGDTLGEELQRATELFTDQRLAGGQIPEHLFVILNGPEPSPVINFDNLATERDLIGAEEEDDVVLFPK